MTEILLTGTLSLNSKNNNWFFMKGFGFFMKILIKMLMVLE